MEEAQPGRMQTHGEARKLLDEAWDRSAKVYKEAKEQADAVYADALKAAVGQEARARADAAHEQALKEAKRLREAITNEAQAVFSEFWRR